MKEGDKNCLVEGGKPGGVPKEGQENEMYGRGLAAGVDHEASLGWAGW